MSPMSNAWNFADWTIETMSSRESCCNGFTCINDFNSSALRLSFQVSERSFEDVAMIHRKMMRDNQRRPQPFPIKGAEE